MLKDPRVTSVATTATLTVDSDTTDQAIITAQTTAVTIAAPTGTPTNGQELAIRITDNGTGRIINWNAIFRKVGGQLPPITYAGLRYIIAFLCFIPFVAKRKYINEIKTLKKPQWKKLILLGFVLIVYRNQGTYQFQSKHRHRFCMRNLFLIIFLLG